MPDKRERDRELARPKAAQDEAQEAKGRREFLEGKNIAVEKKVKKSFQKRRDPEVGGCGQKEKKSNHGAARKPKPKEEKEKAGETKAQKGKTKRKGKRNNFRRVVLCPEAESKPADVPKEEPHIVGIQAFGNRVKFPVWVFD